MTKVELLFKKEKETKNTIRYAEVIDKENPRAQIVGNIYIKKWWLGNPPPEQIKVVLEKI